MEIHASKMEIGIQNWNNKNCRDFLTGSSPTPNKLFPSQPLLVGSHAQPLITTWVDPGGTLYYFSQTLS